MGRIRRGAGQAPRLTQHAAGLGGRDERAGVVGKQETLLHGLRRGAADGGHVAVMIAVALFQRQARIAAERGNLDRDHINANDLYRRP